MRQGTLVLLSASLLLGACGGSVSMPGSQTRGEIEELQRRVIELQRRAAVSEVEIQQLRNEVAALRQGKAPAARVEASAEPGKEARDEAWENPMATEDIESADLPPVEAPKPTPIPPMQEDHQPQPPPSAEAQRLYDQGYTFYHQGRYDEAERIFREFLSTYRMNELSDNAWYWIGESRWARGDVQGSLDAFRETLENYPRGNKTPDALLKMGQCLERLGDRDGALEAYRQLVERYPATAAVTVAEERLSGGSPDSGDSR